MMRLLLQSFCYYKTFLQLDHSFFRHRTEREAADFAIGADHPMTRNGDRYAISRHALPTARAAFGLTCFRASYA